MKLSGWAGYPVLDAAVHRPRSEEAIRQLVLSEPFVIARGSGRAYGDSAVNAAATIDVRHLNRMLAFDPVEGQLVAEAGVLIGDIIAAFLHRGWFPMVSPGTKFVSLGGAIAADVHGKNHHKEGSFRTCVDWIDVMGADGDVQRCSRDVDPALFDNTLGGMGLTGIILRAAIRLRPVESAWIRQTTVPAKNLGAAMAAFEQAQDSTYSVAWIDCLGTGEQLGRSLVMLGEHACAADVVAQGVGGAFDIKAKRKLKVPFDFPSFTLNTFTVRTFNQLYYMAGARRTGTRLVDWDSYFYPLDAIIGWNRIYGRKGFLQFQCVLPLAASHAGLSAMLQAVSKAGSGSFLAVLKRFGAGCGGLSFPTEGYTLALDFPVNTATLALVERLDSIMVDHGGRAYLAKDGRMSAKTLRASDDRVDSFRTFRQARQAFDKFQSAQAQRLEI